MIEIPKLQVFARSRTKTFFKDLATSVTSYNTNGVFDVLALHANFITLISKEIVIDKGLKSEKKFNIDRGLLSVFNDKLDIYIDV